MAANQKLFSLSKISLLLTIISFFIIPELNASNDVLQVGKQVPPWVFDGDGKNYQLDSFPGKMLILDYVDPRYGDIGDEAIAAIKKAVKDKHLTLNIYQPVVIVNSNASWLPNFILKKN